MTTNLIMRKATIADLDLLIKLRIDYLITDRGSLSEAEESAIRSQLQSYYQRQINQNFIAILAEQDNKIMSTAFLAISEKPANPAFITGKTGTILNVLTYPEYRRMGLATKVLNQIIAEAKLLGVSTLELSATPDGKPLYEKLGFAESKSKYTAMKLQLV